MPEEIDFQVCGSLGSEKVMGVYGGVESDIMFESLCESENAAIAEIDQAASSIVDVTETGLEPDLESKINQYKSQCSSRKKENTVEKTLLHLRKRNLELDLEHNQLNLEIKRKNMELDVEFKKEKLAYYRMTN